MSTATTYRLADREVARIGFGAMQLAELRDRPTVSPDGAVAVLRRAVELGVNHIDTAQFYGEGTANARIRAALHPYPDGLALVTKVGAAHVRDRGLVPAQRPEQLRAAVEDDLRSLGVERLTAVNLRRMDGPPGTLAEGDQQVDLDSQLAELIALREAGKIAGIGLSNVTGDQLSSAETAGIVCVQNAYSLVDRSAEPLLERCLQLGIAWVPFFPLGSAFAGYPKVADRPAVQQAAATLGVSAAQVGLAWLLAHAPNTLLIPGTASVAHLEQNMASGSVRLDPAMMAELER